MRHILMLSGGAGSWFAGKRIALANGEPPELLFADTLIEDEDLYRFLIEASADIRGTGRAAVESLRWFWESIPPMDRPEERKVHLASFAAEAMAVIPGLHWLQDGRTPWDVFKDVRFLGNTRVAKCAHTLKQDVCRAWLDANCQPHETTIYVGIHWSESDRFHGTAKKLGACQLWEPWKCMAPLCEQPLLPASQSFEEMDAAGIARPRLYGLGNAHNNCGSFCVKSGQASFRNLLLTMPERYAYHEMKEEELRLFLKKDVAILRDRRGGVTRPMTLREFRERVQAGQKYDKFDFGGCGCFSSPVEASQEESTDD